MGSGVTRFQVNILGFDHLFLEICTKLFQQTVPRVLCQKRKTKKRAAVNFIPGASDLCLAFRCISVSFRLFLSLNSDEPRGAIEGTARGEDEASVAPREVPGGAGGSALRPGPTPAATRTSRHRPPGGTTRRRSRARGPRGRGRGRGRKRDRGVITSRDRHHITRPSLLRSTSTTSTATAADVVGYNRFALSVSVFLLFPCGSIILS